MANLSKVDPSCWPKLVQKRRKLVDQVRAIACEIEFCDERDPSILGRELDRRGVRPLHGGRWYRRGSKNATGTLSRFLQTYCPELLRPRATGGNTRNTSQTE
jgi:hypothetical protein